MRRGVCAGVGDTPFPTFCPTGKLSRGGLRPGATGAAADAMESPRRRPPAGATDCPRGGAFRPVGLLQLFGPVGLVGLSAAHSVWLVPWLSLA